MTDHDHANPFMTLAQDMAEATSDAQKAGLQLLHLEFEALTRLMPGFAPVQKSETALREDEAATEAGFDNLPV